MRNFFLVIAVIFAGFYAMNRFSSSDSSAVVQNNPIAEREQKLNQLVLLQPFKQHHAKPYEEAVQAANTALPNNDIEAVVSGSFWWSLRRVVEQQADDQGQYLWAQAYLQQLYDARRADRCFAIAFPLYSKLPPAQIREFLADSTQKQTADALSYILTHSGSRSVVERMQMPTAWQGVAERLRQEYGADADMINQGEVASDKRKQCDVVIRTFEYSLSLPEQERGPVLRWLLDHHISAVVF